MLFLDDDDDDDDVEEVDDDNDDNNLVSLSSHKGIFVCKPKWGSFIRCKKK
jgi:hypothetical protein